MTGGKLLVRSARLPIARRQPISKTYAFAPDSQPERKSARVLFSIQQRVEFGKQIAVVGSTPSLGSWDPTAGLSLQWREGDTWQSETMIETMDDDIEIKFVIKDEEKVLEWQPGGNITLNISESDPDASAISVEAKWTDGAAIIKKVPMSETVQIKDPVQVADAVKEASRLSGSFSNLEGSSKSHQSLRDHPDQPQRPTPNDLMPLGNAQLERLTVPKLKALASQLGLPKDGKKADLVARLSLAMADKGSSSPHENVTSGEKEDFIN